MKKGIPPFLRSSASRNWLLGLLLITGTILAYQPVWHAGYIWDDDAYVTDNPLLTAPDGLRRIWFSFDSPSQYFPLTYTAFRLEHRLWGFNPAGYHWGNILLHAVNALLVWRLLLRLGVPGAWLAAAIFALHPIQVESVAWITELKNVLMCFFFLLALLSWVEHLDPLKMESAKSAGFYWLALIFYLLALCAKATACTLPAALLLIEWLKKMPITWRRLFEVAPFIVSGVGMGVLTIWWERYHQGTHGGLFALGWGQRILLAGRAIWFYAGKLVWPAKLTFSYPRWTISAGSPWAYGRLLALAALAAVIYRARRRAGRGIEVAVLFYVLTLLPVLGFIMLYTYKYSYVADHYQYVACLGLIALFCAGLARLGGRLKRSRPWLEAVVCCGLPLILGILTWRQAETYADAETLWRATITNNPDSWLATYNLGTTLAQKGEVDEAVANLQKAVKIEPEYAMSQYNLGDILLFRGQVDEAINHLQKACQLEPQQPLPHYKLANALIKKGAVDQGINEFNTALELNPDYAEAHEALGIVLLYSRNRPDQAVVQFQAALASNPEDPEAYNFLGIALMETGRPNEAVTSFQSAVHFRPHYILAENNLAWLLATSSEASVRNGPRAVELAGDASQHSGGQDAMVLMTLAAAYAEAGRYPEAIADAQGAIKLAESQRNAGLAGELQMQLRLYQAGKPFHLPGQTNAPAQAAKP